jgi:alcohol dehydrogenase, propanol-preferring
MMHYADRKQERDFDKQTSLFKVIYLTFNGGYAEYVLVPSYKYLLKMDDEMDTDASATLSCSALTAYGAVKNANLKPYDNVVIVGAGGLGLMSIQLAKAVTGSKIIAMDLDDEKLRAVN